MVDALKGAHGRAAEGAVVFAGEYAGGASPGRSGCCGSPPPVHLGQRPARVSGYRSLLHVLDPG